MSENYYFQEWELNRLNSELLQIFKIGRPQTPPMSNEHIRARQRSEMREIVQTKLAVLLNLSLLTQSCKEFFTERYDEEYVSGFVDGDVLKLIILHNPFEINSLKGVEEIAYGLHKNRLEDIKMQRVRSDTERSEIESEVLRRQAHLDRWSREILEAYGQEIPLLKTV